MLLVFGCGLNALDSNDTAEEGIRMPSWWSRCASVLGVPMPEDQAPCCSFCFNDKIPLFECGFQPIVRICGSCAAQQSRTLLRSPTCPASSAPLEGGAPRVYPIPKPLLAYRYVVLAWRSTP